MGSFSLGQVMTLFLSLTASVSPSTPEPTSDETVTSILCVCGISSVMSVVAGTEHTPTLPSQAVEEDLEKGRIRQATCTPAVLCVRRRGLCVFNSTFIPILFF